MNKSGAHFWLNASEVALLIFGAALVLGLVGEYFPSEKFKRWKMAFVWMVIIGVAGEWIADGGVFRFSNQLEALSERDVGRLNKEAGDARKLAGDADERAATANNNAEGLKLKVQDAQKRAAEANGKYESERIARLKLEQQVAPRVVTSEQKEILARCLAPHKGEKVQMSGMTGEPELEEFGNQLGNALKDAGIDVTEFNLFLDLGNSNMHQGLFIASGKNRAVIAVALAHCFADAHIAGVAMEAGTSKDPNDLTIYVWPKHSTPSVSPSAGSGIRLKTR